MEEILHHRTTYRMYKALKIMEYFLPYQPVIPGVYSINHMSKKMNHGADHRSKVIFSPMDLTPEESV